MSPLSGLVETFGPFLIPAVVFGAGVIGYGVLYVVNRGLGGEGGPSWFPGDERPLEEDEGAEKDREDREDR
jgi:hypothetical protein